MQRSIQERPLDAPVRHTTHRQAHAPRILVAEDDVEMRTILAWALRREGYVVQECHDGTALKKWIDRSHSRSSNVEFDLVITDIRMPGLTGLEVLENAQSRSFRAPIVLISAFCDQKTEDLSRRLGAAALLPKPLDTGDLVALANQLAPIDPALKRQRAEGAKVDRESPLGAPSFPLEIVFLHHIGTDRTRTIARSLANGLQQFAARIHRCQVIIDRLEPDEADGDYSVMLVISVDGLPLVVDHVAGGDEYSDGPNEALRQAFDTAARRLQKRRLP